MQINKYEKRYILGITSLWLLIPSTLYLIQNIEKLQLFSIILFLYIQSITFISTLTYYYFERYTLLIKIDRLLAIGLFLTLMLCQPEIKILPIMIFLFYIISCITEINNVNNLCVLICHLIFRFLGFWWVYIVLLQKNDNILTEIIILSTIYWLYIIYDINNIKKHKNFNIYEYYSCGIKKLLTVILTLIVIFMSIIIYDCLKTNPQI